MKIRKIVALAFGTLMIGATLAGCGVKYSQEEVNQQIADAKAKALIEGKEQGIKEGVASVSVPDITSDNDLVIAEAVQDKEAEIDRLNQVIIDAETAQTEVDAETAIEGYLLDDLEIGVEFNKTFSDREIALLDSEIEFNDDNYEIEETVYLQGTIGTNEEDFNGNSYLQISEEGLTYNVLFDEDLDISEIDEDETLSFSFLGEEVEVSDWSNNQITFTKGTEYTVREGETITVDDRNIEIRTITDTKVLAIVDGVSKVISEGDTEDIGGIQIKVKDCLADDDVVDMATIEIGNDVLFDVDDGDDYAKDSIWTWKITNNSIGIELNEDLTELDEDNMALDAGKSICLPNEYVCVRYDGLTEEDEKTLAFELDTKDGMEFVEAKGSFSKGLEDYSKVWLNATGIYDDDLEAIGTEVDVANTDLVLTAGTSIELDDITMPYNLTKIFVDGDDISSFDENYLTGYGIVIKDPDDNLDDERIKIVLPSEELKAEITVLPKAR